MSNVTSAYAFGPSFTALDLKAVQGLVAVALTTVWLMLVCLLLRCTVGRRPFFTLYLL